MENAIYELTDAIREVGCVDNLDILTIIISVLALILSIYDCRHQNRINKANLQSDYYREIFGVYLKEKIPEAGKKICFDSYGRLDKDYKELNKVLFEMVRKSGYFKYSNNLFYEELVTKVKEFDELLVVVASERVTEREYQIKKLLEIHKKIESIYQVINSAYQQF